METNIRNTINSNISNTSDALLGKASGVDLFSSQKEIDFKSAYKTQLNKRNDKNNLPHSGNDLPRKKVRDHQEQKNDSEAKSVKHSRQTEQSDEQKAKQKDELKDDSKVSKVNGSDTKQNEKQNNNLENDNNNASSNSDDQDDTQESQAKLLNDKNKSDEQSQLSNNALNGTFRNVLTHQNNEGTKQADTGSGNSLMEHSVALDDSQELEQESNASNEGVSDDMGFQTLAHGLAVSDNMASDKKISSEQGNGTSSSSFMKAPMSQEITSQFSSSSGGDKKNDSSMGKSIADFQQFIEMSKKHAGYQEPITSVKNFDESIKVEQANLLSARTEAKLQSGQLMNTSHVAVQASTMDRTNSLTATSPLSAQNMASLGVKTPVGHPGWDKGMSNQIIMMAKNGVHHAKIKLNPRHLGPVEAMVKITGETAVVNLTSLHQTTKEAMDNAIPRLREMLNENGFSQVDVNVSHQDKKEQQEANSSSDGEHGNSNLPGEEQLTEENHDSEITAKAGESDDQGLNIVDYYA